MAGGCAHALDITSKMVPTNRIAGLTESCVSACNWHLGTEGVKDICK